MEFHPTPRSWRIALGTATGAAVVVAVAVFGALHGAPAPLLWWMVAAAGVATLLPAVGTLSASVDATPDGVTVRRFGRTTRFAWPDVDSVSVVERHASVPDGTEYHWIVPSRHAHVVAVPALALRDGTTRELPALAAPVSVNTARDVAAALEQFRKR
jgi:hypothetical protein